MHIFVFILNILVPLFLDFLLQMYLNVQDIQFENMLIDRNS